LSGFNPASAMSGITVHIVAKFASVFYSAGDAGCYTDDLSELCHRCDWCTEKVKQKSQYILF